jgi:hypothetical protein
VTCAAFFPQIPPALLPLSGCPHHWHDSRTAPRHPLAADLGHLFCSHAIPSHTGAAYRDAVTATLHRHAAALRHCDARAELRTTSRCLASPSAACTVPPEPSHLVPRRPPVVHHLSHARCHVATSAEHPIQLCSDSSNRTRPRSST